MRTSLFKIGAAALLFVSNLVVAKLTAEEITGRIDTLTTSTVSLQDIASQIQIVTEIDYFLNRGPVPQLIKAFTNMATDVTTDVSDIDGMAPFAKEADADEVEDAFGVFANALETVLSTMNAKAVLFRLLPAIGSDLNHSLFLLQTALDALVNSLVEVVAKFEEQANSLHSFINELDASFQTTIDTYNGLSIS